ncbi:MAG: hypothetical protein ACYDCC_07790 [Actinomycetota bacterium]
MKRRSFALLVSVLAFVPVISGGPAHAATPTSLLQMVKEEADYIRSMQDGWGVITTTPDHTRATPYHANYAAIGLARAYAVTGDSSYSDAAWRWLDWYRDNMLPDGTIADQILIGSSWQPIGLPDSTDAYAGTYLSAVLAVFENTLNLSQLQGLHDAVNKAIGAIELTRDIDGLHFARPGWPFKYSMDEAEAYKGFLAAQKIATYLRDDAMKARASADATALIVGSARLVDQDSGGLYLWALGQDGTKVKAPISWIYPGASAQAWAVSDGLVTGNAALSLMQRVDAAQPNWDQPDAIAQYYDGHPLCNGVVPCMLPVGYWTHFALAWLALGYSQRALSATINIRAGAIKAARAFPFTPGDSGQIIMVLTDPNVIAATETPMQLPASVPSTV